MPALTPRLAAALSLAATLALPATASASAATPGPAAATCAPTFTFVGQPDCVSLAFDGHRTRLHNACDAAVLVDQSVLLDASAGPAAALVSPGAEVALRDLSAFTLGMEGELHRAVALMDEPPAACAQPQAMKPPPTGAAAAEAAPAEVTAAEEPSSGEESTWLHAAFGAVTARWSALW